MEIWWALRGILETIFYTTLMLMGNMVSSYKNFINYLKHLKVWGEKNPKYSRALRG